MCDGFSYKIKETKWRTKRKSQNSSTQVGSPHTDSPTEDRLTWTTKPSPLNSLLIPSYPSLNTSPFAFVHKHTENKGLTPSNFASSSFLAKNKKTMRYPPVSFLRQNNVLVIRSFVFLFLSCITTRTNLCFSSISSSLKTLPLDGHFDFDKIHLAARDFGNRYQFLPVAVLHPKSVPDIATTIKHIWQMGPLSELTVAARGHGHSLQGQSQAHRGVVINMESLPCPDIQVYPGKSPYVDVSGGELWINILHESLKYGLAPKSWTDYLHLSVGGTLSNAGISGQAFRHGPQISNVHQLEVVTGSSNKNKSTILW